MLQTRILRVLKDSEKHTHKQNWLAGSKRRTMDKEEAERLARAIRKAPVDWIQVSGVEQNPTTDKYEVKCEYKLAQKGLLHSRESWTTLLIKSPRQWIDLLTQRSGGLELP